MVQAVYQVDALWDNDTNVWVATSDDVPGLATEADTLEALSQKLRDMVLELLRLNHVIANGAMFVPYGSRKRYMQR